MIPPDPQSLFLLVDAHARDGQKAESSARTMRMDDVPAARSRTSTRHKLARAMIYLGTRIDDQASRESSLAPTG